MCMCIILHLGLEFVYFLLNPRHKQKKTHSTSLFPLFLLEIRQKSQASFSTSHFVIAFARFRLFEKHYWKRINWELPIIQMIIISLNTQKNKCKNANWFANFFSHRFWIRSDPKAEIAARLCVLCLAGLWRFYVKSDRLFPDRDLLAEKFHAKVNEYSFILIF